MLQEHGTTLMRLKPINIIQAAAADLKLRERKRADEADLDVPYAFARQHVARARSVEHLISLAYFGPEIAAKTDKRGTMIVYGDREVLRLALIDLLLAREVLA